MKTVVVSCLLFSCCVLEAAPSSGFGLDDRTGGIAQLSSSDGRSVMCRLETVYHVMTRAGDVDAREGEDAVVSKAVRGDRTVYRCRNPKFVGVEIVKTYASVNGGLRRTLEFRARKEATNAVYVTPFVEMSFEKGFMDDLWHLGAGYIGPFKPFPHVSTPRPVNEYKQSSKGLVFIHPKGRAPNFSHLRVKINDTVVLPWWHSTIGHYREYHDRLWYLPDGYRMGLGTLDVRPGGSISVTDQFTAFSGGLFDFFDNVFAKDPDIAKEIAAIPPPPAWLDDIGALLGQRHDDFIRWMGEMLDDCEFLGTSALMNSWADYRLDRPIPGEFGGHLTRDEIRAFADRLRTLNPRAHPDFYHIVVSAGKHTRVLKEHPDWFRRTDREGLDDSLFPRLCENYQTMFSNSDCRRWLVDMLVGFENDVGCDTVYTDETQMTNTIDWEHDRITRDDDVVRFWRLLKARLHKEGKLYFANGSGLPYVDLNFMESPDDMAPHRWRIWSGVGFGISMMNRLRPGQRTSPLYWTAKCDYVNRVLALGWIPLPCSETLETLMPIRAAHQYGGLLPVDARYTPDWKADYATEVESYAMKRDDAKDVVLSFINRGPTNDIPVEVDLGTLGFAPNERINVWRTHFDLDRAKTGPHLSDAELRRNWRTEGSVDGASLFSPELVYSGAATGLFRNTIVRLGKDRMEQFLVTAAPLQFFAANDVPLNTFFTVQKLCRIDGRTVRNGRRVDVLLADLERAFADVRANGQPVATRSIRLGGRVFKLLTLDPGEWKIEWREGCVGETEAELPAPPRVRRTAVKPLVARHRCPATSTVERVSHRLDGVEVTEARTYQSDYEDNWGLQRNLTAGVTVADAVTFTLEAGTSRREAVTRDLGCWAGFELHGAKQVRMRFSHTFFEQKSLDHGHIWPWSGGKPVELFTGFVIDFRVKGKYVKRVSVSTGLYNEKCINVRPPWGRANTVADEQLTVGSWIEEPTPREFALDLVPLAPEEWDGVVYFSLGEQRLAPGRSLKAEILGFNEKAGAAFVTPRRGAEKRDIPKPVDSTRLSARPASFKRCDSSEWGRWTSLPGRFAKLKTGFAKNDTHVHVAHDMDFLYLGIQADEPGRRPALASVDPYANEHTEVVLVCADGNVAQYVADAKGQVMYYLDHKETPLPAGTLCRGEVVNGKGWCVFLAIPLKSLGLGRDGEPVSLRANVCRQRTIGEVELSSWSPMGDAGFFDVKNYGTVNLRFR